jgi:diguanylate cyclase (GGDEF)-like protein
MSLKKEETYMKKKIILMSAMIFIVIFLLEILFFQNLYQRQVESYQEERFESLDFQTSLIFDTYKSFSDYLFEKVIQNDEVLSIMDEALNGNETVRNSKRTELYNLLLEDYELMKDYNIRQLHFHFPDTASFLRMHSLDKYGDILEDARYSVWYTNHYKEESSGFEEGRIYNGFRFVYPLQFEEKSIGSVELSVSLSSIINDLTAIYEEQDFVMVIDKEVVDVKVFEDQMDNYEVSYISDDFYIDVDLENSITSRNIIPQDELEVFFSPLTDIETERLTNYNNFFKQIEYNGKKYEVAFFPYKNIEGIPVLYFINIQENNELGIIYSRFVFNAILGSLSTLLVIAFIAVAAMSRTKMRELSETDELTNIFNRRKFNKTIANQISKFKNDNHIFSLILMDIDHFKNINDTYGHPVGDEVLKSLSHIVQNEIRKDDIFARYGGEEFIVLLKNIKIEAARKKAEIIRKIVENHTFETVGHITISLGVACYEKGKNVDTFLSNVDQALYQAKENGRNQTVLYRKIEDN